jgi:hypothetical protein
MRIEIVLIFIILVSCSESHNFVAFTHVDNVKGEQEFLVDSRKCMEEKDKFSNKIQGREFGFEGEHTGYLGCMKLEGWSQKKTP